MNEVTFRDVATDALRYWEPRRLIYNAVLVIVVVGYFIAGWPANRSEFAFDTALYLIALWVLANIAYTTVYIVDVFVQYSAFRPVWLRYRWILFLVGTLFAAIVARGFVLGLFLPVP